MSIDPTRTPLRHGYTYDDIDQLTRAALHRDRWHTQASDRYDAAWHAIAEHLTAATDRPDGYTLIGVGMDASDTEVRQQMRSRGRDPQAAGRAMPHWHRYWNPVLPASPEDQTVDVAALAQIWPKLAPRQRQVLTVLARVGDSHAAAEELGITDKAFRSRLAEARGRFLEWWHEGEAPSRLWRSSHAAQRDGLCRGRQRLTVSQVDDLRARQYAGETVAALAVQAGVARTTLSRLLRGECRPASDSITPATRKQAA
jgi:hypothetical protein